MKTFKRVFALDLPADKAVELTKQSLEDKGYKPVDVDTAVAEDFLGQKTRVITIKAEAA